MKLWEKNSQNSDTTLNQNSDTIDPYSFTRNPTESIELNASCAIGANHPPRIVIKVNHSLEDYPTLIQSICKHQIQAKENKLEGLLISPPQLTSNTSTALRGPSKYHPLFRPRPLPRNRSRTPRKHSTPRYAQSIILSQKLDKTDAHYATQLLKYCRDHQQIFALNTQPQDIEESIGPIQKMGTENLILTTQIDPDQTAPFIHPAGQYRSLVQVAKKHFPKAPIWIRNAMQTASPRRLLLRSPSRKQYPYRQPSL